MSTRDDEKKRKKKNKKKPVTDRHQLYQWSVQAPDHEIELLTKMFKRHTGRKPLSLREDFCGTGLLCAEWVKSLDGRTATGLDIDTSVLAWGTEHNLAPLSTEQRARVQLLPQDVTKPTKQKHELIVGFNYSYSVFKTRDALRAYFKAAHDSLSDDGIFVIDSYGGWEAIQPVYEKRRVRDFIYAWEQADYDPISSQILCHIHFELKDGTKLKKAFTYDWRLWTLTELRELLAEAGFVHSQVYWEGEDENGEGSGEFYRVERVTNDPGWNAYIASVKREPLPGSKDAKRLANERGPAASAPKKQSAPKKGARA